MKAGNSDVWRWTVYGISSGGGGDPKAASRRTLDRLMLKSDHRRGAACGFIDEARSANDVVEPYSAIMREKNESRTLKNTSGDFHLTKAVTFSLSAAATVSKHSGSKIR